MYDECVLVGSTGTIPSLLTVVPKCMGKATHERVDYRKAGSEEYPNAACEPLGLPAANYATIYFRITLNV